MVMLAAQFSTLAWVDAGYPTGAVSRQRHHRAELIRCAIAKEVAAELLPSTGAAVRIHADEASILSLRGVRHGCADRNA